jgi:hypothetical protein
MKAKNKFYLNWKWWVCLPYLLSIIPLMLVFYVISGAVWVVGETCIKLHSFLWFKLNYTLGKWLGIRRLGNWIWREDDDPK